jgi:hypothetical protein
LKTNPNDDLSQKDWSALINEVAKLRAAIRQHRDQKDDARCHMDDDLLYEVLPEGKPKRKRKLPCNFLDNCRAFFENRQNVEFKSVDELYKGWDNSRPYLSNVALKALLGILQESHADMSSASCNDYWLKNTDENWQFMLEIIDAIDAEGNWDLSEDDKQEMRTRPPKREKITLSDLYVCEYFIRKVKGMIV